MWSHARVLYTFSSSTSSSDGSSTSDSNGDSSSSSSSSESEGDEKSTKKKEKVGLILKIANLVQQRPGKLKYHSFIFLCTSFQSLLFMKLFITNFTTILQSLRSDFTKKVASAML